MIPEPLADILEVQVFRGPDASPDALPEVLIEVPHGATTQAHFDATRALLTRSEVPEDIVDFYWVNTDVGAPEYAQRFAEMITDPAWVAAHTDGDEAAAEAAASRSVLLLRGVVPRTFCDLNRVFIRDPNAFLEAGLTLAVPDFVHPDDALELHRRHVAYQDAVEAAYADVLGSGGRAYNLHTYAPISVSAKPGVPVLEVLREAYAPEAYPHQIRRPIGQLITARVDGPETADPALRDAVLAHYQAANIGVTLNTPYQLHPVTTLDARAHAWPGQILSVELSREALATDYAPFVELEFSPEAIERLTAPLALGHITT